MHSSEFGYYTKALASNAVLESCNALIVGDAWIMQRKIKKYAPGKTLNAVQKLSVLRILSKLQRNGK